MSYILDISQEEISYMRLLLSENLFKFIHESRHSFSQITFFLIPGDRSVL